MLSMVGKLRTRLVARQRRQKKLRHLHASDVVMVTHTKSGRTWLLVMVSHVYHLRFGTPANEIVNDDNFHMINPQIPRITSTWYDNLVHPDESGSCWGLSPSKRYIFLFRDPRDVVVSYYFHLRHRSTPKERAHKGISEGITDLSLYAFAMHEQVGLPAIVARMNRWARELELLEHTLFVRYEDLHARPLVELKRVMAFLGAECDDDELAAAVAFASFQSLKRREGAAFFATERLRPTEPSNPDSFKVRRGKVGGYRDDFTPEQAAAMDEFVRTRLSPRLGYH